LKESEPSGASKVKKASSEVNPSVGDSRRVLGDLLIIATVFVTLSAFNSIVLAVPGLSYVAAANNGGQFAYRSVKGNQDTLQFYVFNGVGSFVSLGQDAANTWSVGFMKGWVPNNDTDGTQGWTNLSTPYFFVDRWRNGVHNFKYFTPAAGNHQYMAFLFHNSATGTNTMYAIIDSTTLQTSLSGYTYAACVASGQTETHEPSLLEHEGRNAMAVVFSISKRCCQSG
jgi:hypothetical protein